MSKINYDLTKIKGIVFDIDGVLSPSTVSIDENGIPARMTNLKDGYAMQQAIKSGIKIALISGASEASITKRFRALGVKDLYLGVKDKLYFFNLWVISKGLDFEQVAYVGDDMPDLHAMKIAGLAVAPNDAAIDVKTIADYICVSNGGYGVARELIEEILKAKDMWPDQNIEANN